MIVTGPNVVSWHGKVDWRQVAGEGHNLAWCAATSGVAGVDEQFADSWTGIPAAGMVRGAVHTLSGFYAGRAQARHMVDVVGVDLAGSLAALDVDLDQRLVGHGRAQLEQVVDFAEAFAELTSGHPLLIRTSWRGWARLDPDGLGARISPYLWHTTGHWKGWSMYGGWLVPTMWQYRRSHCPGVTGLCGINVFHGDRSSLSALAGAPEPAAGTAGATAGRRRGLRGLIDRLGRPRAA